jgi:bifunctional hydroxylase/dehydrase
VGARLLMNTRAQGIVFLGGEEADPLRDLFTELIAYDDVKRHLAGIVTGLDIRYDVGAGSHPLLGRRLPNRALRSAAGQTSTTRLLHPAQGVLLDIADDAATRTVATGWKDRVVTITATPAAVDSADPLAGTAAVLVRPDGYVAWTATDAEDDLSSALHQWFGAPTALAS